jgi:hypothetical protein
MDERETRVAAISEYLFANPLAKRADIFEIFGKKWQTTTRTLDRIWKEAKTQNDARVKEYEKMRDAAMSQHIEESIKRDIADREELLEVLTNTVRGKAKKIVTHQTVEEGKVVSKEEEIIFPSFSEQTGAAKLIAVIQGYEATKKIDMDIGQKPPTKVIVEFVDFSQNKGQI